MCCTTTEDSLTQITKSGQNEVFTKATATATAAAAEELPIATTTAKRRISITMKSKKVRFCHPKENLIHRYKEKKVETTSSASSSGSTISGSSNSLWFSKEDYRRMRSNDEMIINFFMTTSSQEEDEQQQQDESSETHSSCSTSQRRRRSIVCTRGLEKLTREGFAHQQLVRKTSIRCVLLEQTRQRKNHITDVVELANVYAMTTSDAKQEAQRMGNEDEEEAVVDQARMSLCSDSSHRSLTSSTIDDSINSKDCFVTNISNSNIIRDGHSGSNERQLCQDRRHRQHPAEKQN